MKNIVDLRSELAKTITQLRAGDIDRKVADSITNACGKIMNSIRDEMTYYRDRDEEPTIAFLNAPGSSGKKKFQEKVATKPAAKDAK